MVEEIEEIIVSLFGEISYDRFENAGVPEERHPTLHSLLSHVRECLDEEKFSQWVTSFIALESLSEPVAKIHSIRKTEE